LGASNQRPCSLPPRSAPKHELGIDIAAFWANYSLGGASSSNFNIMTPVDIRLGIVSKTNMMWEPRLSFAFASGIGGGNSATSFNPDVNLLFTMGKAKARNDNKYFTVGAGFNLTSAGGQSVTQLALNGAWPAAFFGIRDDAHRW
jgi:hypothetical protein